MSMPRNMIAAIFTAACLIVGAVPALAKPPAAPAAPVEIQFWHSQNGAAGDQLSTLVEKFNQSQKNVKVVALYKGFYAESMAAALAAAGTPAAPDIVQVFENGTETMAATLEGGKGKKKRPAIKPVYQVMAEGGQKFDAKAYIPVVAGYYEDKAGHLLSLPFNSSTPVFYFNKDAFKKAGLDPEAPPKTWHEVQVEAQKVRASEATPCAFTTSWQSWIQIENLHAWHNELFASELNGLGGLNVGLLFNDHLEVLHIALLSAWVKGELFNYYGRNDEADAKFAAGECAMMTSSSAAYAGIKQSAKFNFGVSQLPVYEDYKNAPQNTLIGGASLWVMAGKKPAAYKGVAQFFNYISQPEVQAQWAQDTGYLPITTAAYELSKKQGYYDKNPGSEVAILEVITHKPTPISKGIRLGNFPQIRQAMDEELENVWHNKKPAKQALDDAVNRGNESLRQFEKANK
jgi:sn-glycerol 3-phosphate transport system substrate-binding protein